MGLLFPSLSPSAPSLAPLRSSEQGGRSEDGYPAEPSGTPSGCPVGGSLRRSWLSRMRTDGPSGLSGRLLPGNWFRWVQRLPEGETRSEKGNVTSHDEFTQQAIDLRNMMPDIPNTSESGLSTRRESSSIPKTGESKTWVYPSSAQFFRALQRRGKDADKETMPGVVYVHNLVNEKTWEKIQELEKKHPECAEPTLTRFCGRSDDRTLTARLMNRLGWWGELFDRHDWYIDRCGKQVRYIIDYYDDPRAQNIAEVYIHARPAIFDSFENFRDTVRQSFESLWRGERP